MADLIVPGVADGGGYPVDPLPEPAYPRRILRAQHGGLLSVSPGMASLPRYRDLPEESLDAMKSRCVNRPGAFVLEWTVPGAPSRLVYTQPDVPRGPANAPSPTTT